MRKVLVVDDDPAIQRVLKRLFEPEGFEVEITNDGYAALAAFRNAPPSAVILDLRLPGLSGIDLCKAITEENQSVPVIILTANTHTAEKVVLLELGADDYITKPFSPREVLARVNASLRRVQRLRMAGRQEVYVFGQIAVDLQRMEAFRSGKRISLTANEFRMLEFFLHNPGQVFSREQLLNALWGADHPFHRSVDTQIMKLRQKLETDPCSPRYFVTVHGIGYMFNQRPQTPPDSGDALTQ